MGAGFKSRLWILSLEFGVHVKVTILMDIEWSDTVNIFEHIVQSLFNTCFLAFVFTSTSKSRATQRVNYNYLIRKSNHKYSSIF
jgi:hypothetical protein